MRDPALLLLRAVLVLALLAAAWRQGHRLLAVETALNANDLEDLQRAMERDPENPDTALRLAQVYRDQPGDQNLAAALEHARRAAELAPYSWRAQWELAQLLEMDGRVAEAEAAYLAAIDLNPREASYYWRLANFYLRRGEADEMAPPLRRALQEDARLQRPGLDLLLKAGASVETIDELWPEDRNARLLLLRSLCRELGDPDPAHPDAGHPDAEATAFLAEEWQELMTGEDPLTVNEGAFYPAYLVDRQEYRPARGAWIDLTAANGLVDDAFAEGENLVWNGRFELESTGFRLGWQILEGEGFEASLVEGGGVYDSVALQIRFLGTENVHAAPVRQTLLLEPNATYELSYQSRCADLTTDQGIYLDLYDLQQRRLLLTTEPCLGTQPWLRALATFETFEDTRLALLRIRRDRSRRIGGAIEGSYWLDTVSVAPSPARH